MIGLEDLIAALPLDQQIAIRNRTQSLIDEQLKRRVVSPTIMPNFESSQCPNVQEAKTWRNEFGLPPNPEGDRLYANCEFVSNGCDIKCVNCDHWIFPHSPHYDEVLSGANLETPD